MLAKVLAADWRQLRERRLEPVAVAVLDSGIDATHKDLMGRIAGAATVEEETGSPPVVREVPVGVNNDCYGHGTAVAGIIAAVAPNARLFDLKVLTGRNTGSTGGLLAGFRHALTQPWRLFNLSVAAEPSIQRELSQLCEQAYYQNQVVVAARRNLPFGDDGLPAEFSSCIGVDQGDYATAYEYAYQSGSCIEFEARGEGVVAPAPGNGYKTVTGTSFATPVVCGLCALLLGAYPQLTPFDVKAALREMAGRRKIGETE